MARLPRAVIDSYTAQLNSLSNASRRILAARLANIAYDSIVDLREQVIAIMEPLCAASSDAAAAMAADFYDSVREYEAGSTFGAQAASQRASEATEKAVRALVQLIVDGKPFEQFMEQLLERVDFEVKRAAGECVKANAARDPLKPRWARVPSGSETCDFCLMLASRGFVYSSDRAAGGDGHYHPNCDCRIVPGFDGDTRIEGYDPDALYEQWKESVHAEYMKRRAEGKRTQRKRPSSYRREGGDGQPSFGSFSDVKEYIYSASDQEDLEHRFNVVGGIFGFDSPQMRSQSMKNAVRHAQKRL